MDQSRTSNSIRNVTASVLYQVINIIVSFVTRSIFVQVMGKGYLGLNGLFYEILGMLNVADLGLGTVMIYSMYRPLAENDQDKLAALTGFYKKVYRLIALLIVLFGLAVVPFLPYIVNLEQEIDHITFYYLLFLVCHISSYLQYYKTNILYADQKNYLLIKYLAYWGIAQTVVMSASLVLFQSYTIYLVLQIVFEYGKVFHQAYVAQKRYPFIDRKVELDKEEQKSIFRDVKAAFVYRVSNVIMTGTDNTLISILVGTEAVGLYANYRMLALRLNGMIEMLFNSLVASLGNLIAQKNQDQEKCFRVYGVLQSISFMIATFCTACLFWLGEDLITVWLGRDFTLGWGVLATICLNFYLLVVLYPVVSFREAAGLFRKIRYVMLAAALLNILLSIAGGLTLGLVGILGATFVSKIATTFWYEPRLLFREYFGRPVWLYYWELAKGLAGTAVVMGGAGLLWSGMEVAGWGAFLLKTVGVGCTVLVLTGLVYCRSKGARYLLEKAGALAAKLKKS